MFILTYYSLFFRHLEVDNILDFIHYFDFFEIQFKLINQIISIIIYFNLWIVHL
jgi:hypothetical protein